MIIGEMDFMAMRSRGRRCYAAGKREWQAKFEAHVQSESVIVRLKLKMVDLSHARQRNFAPVLEDNG